MYSQNEISYSETTSSAAIRSLNVDFVRKGIVVSDGCEGERQLDPKIRHLVEALKGSCQTTGTRDISDITSAIQLWKERSLHHTLQTLDQARQFSQGDAVKRSSERQIQAIELHEKAGREVKEAVFRVLQNMIDGVLRHIEGFTVELEAAIRELLKPELEEELDRERAMTERLINEKQRYMSEHIALQEAHAKLTQRMDEWETDDNGGGDAALCRKLREQIKLFKQTQTEMEHKMVEMEQQSAQRRYEMVSIKTELDTAHKTLAMTRAMHDKETKQLTELVNNRDNQFERVRQATATAKAMATTPRSDVGTNPTTITSFDAYSGRSICYQSPTKPLVSPSKTTRKFLASMPPPQSRGMPLEHSTSPNKKRSVTSTRPHTTANRQDDEKMDLKDPTGRSHSLVSPKVLRIHTEST